MKGVWNKLLRVDLTTGAITEEAIPDEVFTTYLGAAGLGAWPVVPFTFNPSPGAPLTAAADSVSPWPVLLELARFLDSRPELSLQVLLFAVFSLPAYAWMGSSRERRMWGATTYLSALFSAFVLLPIAVLGVPVELLPFLAAYVPCAIIGFLSALLISFHDRGTL